MLRGDFYELEPVEGKITGEKAKGVLLKTGLANDQLKRIWIMSDMDKDGKLDLEEFIVAMTLAKVRPIEDGCCVSDG